MFRHFAAKCGFAPDQAGCCCKGEFMAFVVFYIAEPCDKVSDISTITLVSRFFKDKLERSWKD